MMYTSPHTPCGNSGGNSGGYGSSSMENTVTPGSGSSSGYVHPPNHYPHYPSVSFQQDEERYHGGYDPPAYNRAGGYSEEGERGFESGGSYQRGGPSYPQEGEYYNNNGNNGYRERQEVAPYYEYSGYQEARRYEERGYDAGYHEAPNHYSNSHYPNNAHNNSSYNREPHYYDNGPSFDTHHSQSLPHAPNEPVPHPRHAQGIFRQHERQHSHDKIQSFVTNDDNTPYSHNTTPLIHHTNSTEFPIRPIPHRPHSPYSDYHSTRLVSPPRTWPRVLTHDSDDNYTVYPATQPTCRSVGDVNPDDVLCGRGGGTNSQSGNRKFRKLVHDFQPEYLRARRKSKPRIAKRIVQIVRRHGGRFLKKHEETGYLYEVGDERAESKTSQALREGLDVRAGNKKTTDNKKREREDEEEPESNTKPKLDDESTEFKGEETNVPHKTVNANEPPSPKDSYPETWSEV